MSVVNKMLKDLENREASQASPANYQPPVRKSSSALRISLILIVGVVAIGAVYFWPQGNDDRVAASPSIGPINQLTASSPAAQGSVPDEPEAEPEPVTEKVTASSPALQPAGLDDVTPKNTMGRMAGPFDASTSQNTGEPPLAAPAEVTAAPTARQRLQAQESTPAPVAEPIIKPSSADPEEALKAQIRQAIAQNDTPAAITLLRTLIRQQPDNVAARKRLAALYFSAGRVTDAQQLLQQSVAAMPADSSVRLMYARLLVQQNETKLAYYSLQDINDYGQPSIELLGYRASLAQKLELMDDALKDYAQLVELDSQTAKWWLGQAVVADKQGYTALALNSYREALSLHQLEAGIEQFIRQRLTTLTGVSS